MKDLPLWSFFSLTMCRPPMAICSQMELPATSHPRADWRLDSHTSLEQYPIKAPSLPPFVLYSSSHQSFPLFLRLSPFFPLPLASFLSIYPPVVPTHSVNPLQKKVSGCIIIGSQAPIPKLSVPQHLDLADRSQQSKISRKYYGGCANMINDMLRSVSKYWEVGSVPGAAQRLFK